MWLTFVALTLSIWSLASGWHKGEPAVFALHPMAIGDVVRDADVSLGYIDGATVDYIDDVSLLIGKQLTAPLSAGQPITAGALVTTSGWTWLNIGSIVPVALAGLSLLWLVLQQKKAAA